MYFPAVPPYLQQVPYAFLPSLQLLCYRVLGVHAIGVHFSMSHFPAVQPMGIGKTPMHASAHIGVKRIPIQAALDNSPRDNR